VHSLPTGYVALPPASKNKGPPCPASERTYEEGTEAFHYRRKSSHLERWHKSLKSECIRPGTPLSLEDARRLVEGYVEHYNNAPVNSATGYITPTGRAGGALAGDPPGTRPQVGNCQTATPESPAVSRVKSEAASHRDVGQS
jgi:hypothetical protein